MRCLFLFLSLFASLQGKNDYFLIVLVDARRLNYSGNSAFLRSLAKHPSDMSKNGDAGHAWIYLKGKDWVLEGGHTGEFGIFQPKYFEGVLNRCLKGEKNPAAYLWESLYDGQFQRGSGGHKPTFAAKIDLTEEQFEAIRDFVSRYDFQEYSLTKKQCVNFVCRVAALAGLELTGEMTLHIEKELRMGRRRYCLWSDPAFAELTLASPDRLEKSLMQAVREKRAEYALRWYLHHHAEPFSAAKFWENVIRFPKRISLKLAL